MSTETNPTTSWVKSVLDILPTILVIGAPLTYLFRVIGESYIQGYANWYRVSPAVFASWSAESLIFGGVFTSIPTLLNLLLPLLLFLGLAFLLSLGMAFAEPKFKSWWLSRKRRSTAKQKISISEGWFSQADRMATLGFHVAVFTLGILLFVWIVQDAVNRSSMIGRTIAQRNLATSAVPIDLISSQPLPRLEGDTYRVEEATYYIKKVYLISVNEGYYYVFENLDPTTCRPEVITTLPVNRIEYLQTYPPEILDENCIPK